MGLLLCAVEAGTQEAPFSWEPEHFSDAPSLILHATLWGAGTGTAQAGERSCLGPVERGRKARPPALLWQGLAWLPELLLAGSERVRGDSVPALRREEGWCPEERWALTQDRELPAKGGHAQENQRRSLDRPPGGGRKEQSPATHWEALPSSRVPPEQMNAFYRCGCEMKMKSLSH